MAQDNHRTEAEHNNQQNPAAAGHAENRNAETGDSNRKGKGQGQDRKGEAQNVNDDEGRPLNEDELEHQRNKALQDKEEQSRH